MKISDTLKIAGIVGAGVAVYLVVTRTMKAGGSIAKGVADVVTKDVNPASGENIVTTAIQSTPAGQTFHRWLGDTLGSIFDPVGYAAMKANESHSNVTVQAKALTGAAADAVRETEREKLRQMEASYKTYVNPLANVETLNFNPTTQEVIWP